MSLYKDITENEMKIVLSIIKNPHIMYNANSISKISGISSMGALKILKKLEKESILIPKKIGRSTIYRIDTKNNYSRNYIKLLLSRESTSSVGIIKRWVNEIKKIKSSDISILFGSVLKDKEPNDIDVLFVTDQKKFE
ncbi:MAG: hypothetical protein KKI14_01545, partial [Nanoarchaeota archaeon]|nr:hypothetical protein [Nanoarchaeota archaeon]